MAIRPVNQQSTLQTTDTSSYNKWYRTWQVCSIAANKTTTVLKTAAAAATLSVSWYLGGWWFAAPIAGPTVYQLFGKKSAHRDSHEMIDLLVGSLDTLSKRVPPLVDNPRIPATLQQLLLKDSTTYTRDDYRYLIEHILMQSKALFDWYSLTGSNRAPFDRLLTALGNRSNNVIQKELNAVLAKLIELRQRRAGTQTEAHKIKVMHPRLKELTEALLLMKKSVLTERPLSAAEFGRCGFLLRTISQDPEGFSLITASSLNATERETIRNNLCNLLTDLNNNQPLEIRLNTALEHVRQRLPVPSLLHTQVTSYLSQEPLLTQTLPVPLATSNALHRLRRIVNQNPVDRRALFQTIKAISLCRQLSLEEALRAHLKTHYQPRIAQDYPLQAGEADDSERPFNEFLSHQDKFPQEVILEGLNNAFISTLWHAPLFVPDFIKPNSSLANLDRIIEFILNRPV